MAAPPGTSLNDNENQALPKDVDYSRIQVANLEEELGCFDRSLLDASPTLDHGDSQTAFEVSTDSTSRLDPPSKTKSFYPFGIDGTLVWTTAAGELIQVARCIENRLVGAEYKGSIERGRDYYDRSKMLEEAVNQPQGSGFGIGLSIGIDLEPYEMCWVNNRWPRFNYRYEGLEVRLQYYIHSHSVVQEYQIRNTTYKDVFLPYTFSSDICFLEHKGWPLTFHDVEITQCRERLLLFQNSEVLVRNEKEGYQLTMSFFLNARRQGLWTESRLSGDDDGNEGKDNGTESLDAWTESRLSGDDDGNEGKDNRTDFLDEEYEEFESLETSLREIIFAGDLLGESRGSLLKRRYRKYNGRRYLPRRPAGHRSKNFSTYSDALIVPGGSTQELLAVIRLSSQKTGSYKPEDGMDTETSDNEPGSIVEKIDKQRAETDKVDRHSRKLPKGKLPVAELRHHYLELGRDCERAQLVGDARYYLYLALLIAEYSYRVGSYTLNQTRFLYAKFLNDYGWHHTALRIMEDTLDTISNHNSRDKSMILLREKVQYLLASLYLARGNFAEAEKTYEKAMTEPIANGIPTKPASARWLERIAWAQVHQEKYEVAHQNYSTLLGLPTFPRGATLSNLGFIERKLDDMDRAMSSYKSALSNLADGLEDSVEQLCAKSGLFACLLTSGASPEDCPEVSSSLIPYVDVSSHLLHLPNLKSHIIDGPFHFAISRQLESLLSTCSIPVTTNDELAGVAFVDANPLACLSESRSAYFQFRFLTQCQKYIDGTQKDGETQRETSKRIKAACRSHLIWVFKIARLTETWNAIYSVGGDPEVAQVPSHKPSTSRVIEGAFHFSKLWLYYSTWPTEWDFVLELLHFRLGDWLSYLRNSQYMANLWVTRQEDVTLKPHDTISPENGSIQRTYPQYHLSDFTMLWIALCQLEGLVDSIGQNTDLRRRPADDLAKSRFDKVRQILVRHRKALSIRSIHSNILQTFIVSKRGATTIQSDEYGKTATTPKAAGIGEPQTALPINSLRKSPVPGVPTIKVEDIVLDPTDEPSQQIVAYQRTISDHVFEIDPSDIATIEAASFGFFDKSKDQVSYAWRENLKFQGKNLIESFHEPRQVALTWFAAKYNYSLTRTPAHEIEDICRGRLILALYDSGAFAQRIVDDAPGPLRDWSADHYEALSILLACLFNECRPVNPSDGWSQDPQSLQTLQVPGSPVTMGPSLPKRIPIMMPQQVGTASKSNQKTVVDSGFLPDWMYRYPDYIHKEPLEIDFNEEYEQLGSFGAFKSARDSWEASKGFSREPNYSWRFPAHIADLGTKRSTDLKSTSARRRMDVDWYWSAQTFYDHLVRLRTFDEAKKRLIELASHNQETVLICWLTAPQQEKPNFLEFLRRHDNTPYPNHLHLKDQLYRIKQMPSLSEASDQPEITPVTMSLRFVGDLRDRSWTCHYFSSVARENGFTGLVDQYTDSGTDDEEFYVEVIGQRKVLEMAYIEKMLIEVGKSSDEISSAFQTELELPETRDPQNESYEFIHKYSRLHSKAGEILRAVVKHFNSAIGAIEEWEKREETKPFRSRWL
ncbi:MAG: hypothetical protein Q9188_006027 [Gyalolechia gomerana]